MIFNYKESNKSYTPPATRRRDTPTQLEERGDETPGHIHFK